MRLCHPWPARGCASYSLSENCSKQFSSNPRGDVVCSPPTQSDVATRRRVPVGALDEGGNSGVSIEESPLPRGWLPFLHRLADRAGAGC
jgi:hypothetical protein